ncbi:MAG: hypothetical protein JWQ43_3037, partial [Glaciihabitans sp.]|nr:hypothetical protein [Glaciihabitans sp.]
NFWLGFEDVDYGLTAWTRGIRCYYEPASLLIHHESASRGYSQSQRELASMRYFWRKWQPQFLARTVGNAGSATSTTSATSTPPVTSTTPDALTGSIAVQLSLPQLDYIVSERSPAGWAEFVTEQAARLAELGHSVAVHQTNSAAPDEALIESLSGRDSLKVAADWGAGVTTWLASLETGKPVYLLPTVESGAFPADPATQARIVAQYRPEFEYVAPNRWTADQLRAETAWESGHRVVPALSPQPLPTTAVEPVVATVGLSPELRTALGAITRRLGVELRHFDAADGSVPLSIVEQLRNIHPRAIVSLVEFDSALSPLALMSLGAAFIGRLNDKTRYEVLDGYNALLVAPGAVDDLERALAAVMTDDCIATELAGNGFETAERFAQLNPRAMSLALVDIAQTSV